MILYWPSVLSRQSPLLSYLLAGRRLIYTVSQKTRPYFYLYLHNLSLTTCFRLLLFSDLNISHLGLKCGGVFNNDFIENFLLNLSVKEFWKSLSIWRSYEQKYNACFLTHSVQRTWILWFGKTKITMMVVMVFSMLHKCSHLHAL